MTNSTYSGLRKIVSTVKKSHASRACAWVRRNFRQEVRVGLRQPRHAAGITARIERRSAVGGHRLYTAYRLIALRGLCVTRRRASLIVSP